MDKVAYYKEEIEKLAEDISGKDILRTIKTKNLTPKLKFNDYFFPDPNKENFSGKVKSNLSPTFNFDATDEDKVNYRTVHSGAGRLNQRLEAINFYNDVPKYHLKGESLKQYNKRQAENLEGIENSIRNGIIGGAITAGASTIAGGALGAAIEADESLKGLTAFKGGITGLLLGLGLGSAVYMMNHKRQARKYIDKLKPHERELLYDLIESDAAKISQNARAAHVLRAYNQN